jgi:hypothetical protein
LLKQIKFAGFYEGMAAGILWLALLRSTKRPQKPLVHASPAAPSTPRFIGIWILDVTVASVMGVAVYGWSRKLQKIEKKFEAIPLTAGRSAVSREFCPALVQELRKMAQSESNTAPLEASSAAANGNYSNIHDIINHPVNPVLKTYVTFAVNCQRRTQREEELRGENLDMEASEPPFIPEPGLPPLQDLPDKDATTWILQGQSDNTDDLPQHDEWDQVDFETDWQSRE